MTRPYLADILAFLSGIGIPVEARALGDATLLSGMTITGGVIFYDPTSDFEVGDLLHEAGHWAVASREQRKADPFQSSDGDEMTAIAWSVAAARHLGVPLAVLFHDKGYRGGGDSIAAAFEQGPGFGAPMLHYYGMAIEPRQAEPGGPPPFPHMLRWIR